jgi:hypothetical protein
MFMGRDPVHAADQRTHSYFSRIRPEESDLVRSNGRTSPDELFTGAADDLGTAAAQGRRMPISIQQIVLMQLQTAAAERRGARDERKDLRDEHLEELTEKADLQLQSANLQIDVNIDKSKTSAWTSPFGAVGTIAGSVVNIGTDETKGRRVGVLEREAGLAERDAASISHDLEETKATERARTEEAQQAYQAGVDAMEKLAEVSRIV